MADKQISQLTASTIGSNSDCFMFDDAEGVTYKIPYSALASAILQTSLGAGTGISITQDTGASVFKVNIASTVEGSRWYYGTSQPQNAGNGDYWIDATSGHNLSVYQYNGSTWTDTGMDMKGADGTNGTNGYSISATTTTITGGHRVTIHSTDPNVPDTYFDVMDGTGGGGGGGVTRTVLWSDNLQSWPEEANQTSPINLSQSWKNFDELEITYWRGEKQSPYGVSSHTVRMSCPNVEHAETAWEGDWTPQIVLTGLNDEYLSYTFDSDASLVKHSSTGTLAALVITDIVGVTYSSS